jgi:hypothetical protein
MLLAQRRGSSTLGGTNVVVPMVKSAAVKNCHSLHLTVGGGSKHARISDARAAAACLLPDGNGQALLMRGLPAPSGLLSRRHLSQAQLAACALE